MLVTDNTTPSSFLSDDNPSGLHISDIGYPGETIQFTYHAVCAGNLFADLNNDDLVDILDIVLLVNFVLDNFSQVLRASVFCWFRKKYSPNKISDCRSFGLFISHFCTSIIADS